MKLRGPDPESKKPPFIPHLGSCDSLQSPGWCCDLLTTGRTFHSQTKKAGLTSHSAGDVPFRGVEGGGVWVCVYPCMYEGETEKDSLTKV